MAGLTGFLQHVSRKWAWSSVQSSSGWISGTPVSLPCVDWPWTPGQPMVIQGHPRDCSHIRAWCRCDLAPANCLLAHPFSATKSMPWMLQKPSTSLGTILLFPALPILVHLRRKHISPPHCLAKHYSPFQVLFHSHLLYLGAPRQCFPSVPSLLVTSTSLS